jgi:outer membrane protein assembly factor BamE (lipoprotein component of BamABCDE complex)
MDWPDNRKGIWLGNMGNLKIYLHNILIVIGKVIGVVLAGIIAFAIMLVIGVKVWIWWYQFDSAVFYEDKFNRELWLADDGIDKCIRGRMYGDLVANYLKKGMTKDELIGLIGDPFFGRVYYRFYRDKKCYKYLMGGCKSYAPDATLLVCFNSDEEVNDIFRSDGSDSGESIHLNELNFKE